LDIRTLSLEPDCFYHIYNRGINGENIFMNNGNYIYFLGKISAYLTSVCNIYAYCLLPNHFHIILQLKSKEELISFYNLSSPRSSTQDGLHSPNNIFSKQFSKVFNSYSQSFNKQINRHGSLIESPFKRKLISSEEYLKQAIIYTHQNPQNHGLVNDFKEYSFSSYHSIKSNSKTILMRMEVIELFDNLENFVVCHENKIEMDNFLE
jgi:REP element-mobilizing transposase RayT